MAKIKIMIDPGHGAKDPGGIGNGLKEKDLVLGIAKRVKEILDTYDGVEVRLTRSTDVFLELWERTDLANAWGADIFISIHTNAGGGTGFETFVFNGNPAASTVAAQNVIHAAIIKAIGGVDRGKKRADYSVLRRSKMTAVLTEVAFIDNAKDAANLKKADFLEKAAQGHADGLVALFGLKKKGSAAVKPKDPVKPVEKPSEPTAVKPSGTYVVKAGDTLNKIAAAHNTSSAALAALNGLKDPNKIAAGQQLKIPVKTHTVKVGESLTKIAAANKLSIEQLVKLNGLKDKNLIFVGQVLKLN